MFCFLNFSGFPLEHILGSVSLVEWLGVPQKFCTIHEEGTIRFSGKYTKSSARVETRYNQQLSHCRRLCSGPTKVLPDSCGRYQ